MRDLEKDLEICINTHQGPWEITKKDLYFIEDSVMGLASTIYFCDAIFIAEAREGWPHAIYRAIEAEKKVKELQEQVELLELQCILYDAHR